MYAESILPKLFDFQIHKKRKASLFSLVDSLCSGSELTVTALGRGNKRAALEKHRIKQADRLLSNTKLKEERISFYKQTAMKCIGSKRRPVIIVDWSDFDSKKRLFILRASLAADGRAVTLYEDVFDKYLQPSDETNFLITLKSILPDSTKPIIVTDAGFRIPWLKKIENFGWDYLGRVRGRTKIQHKTWLKCSEFSISATRKPKGFSDLLLGEKAKFRTNLVLYKGKKVGRVQLTKFGTKYVRTNSKKYSREKNEPWILCTSLPKNKANKVVKLYKLRMQIEESFRDLKSSSRLRKSRTFKVERAKIILLIHHLASLVYWVAGLRVKKLGLNLNYQANTLKKNVLSIVYLGTRALREKHKKLKIKATWRDIEYVTIDSTNVA